VLPVPHALPVRAGRRHIHSRVCRRPRVLAHACTRKETSAVSTNETVYNGQTCRGLTGRRCQP